MSAARNASVICGTCLSIQQTKLFYNNMYGYDGRNDKGRSRQFEDNIAFRWQRHSLSR